MMRLLPLYALLLTLVVGCSAETKALLRKSDDPLTRAIGTLQTDVNEIPLAEEREHGSSMAAMLLGASPLLKNAEVQRYVNQVGRWIALHSERPDLPWRFGVIESDDVNAFALPGGYVLISTGLLRKLRSEAELAAVLGHEIVHTQNRHHLKAMKRGAMGDIAKQALTAWAEHKQRDEITLAANASKGFLVEGYLVNGLDKHLEYEADAQGVVLAARAGYNPYAMAGVLQTLGAGSETDAGMVQWTKGHPKASERMARLSQLMGDTLDAYSDVPEDNSRFQRMLRLLPAAGKGK